MRANALVTIILLSALSGTRVGALSQAISGRRSASDTSIPPALRGSIKSGAASHSVELANPSRTDSNPANAKQSTITVQIDDGTLIRVLKRPGSPSLQEIVQLLSLLILTIYVWKTWEMASATRQAASATAEATHEMKEARRAARTPRIGISFSVARRLLAEIVIENFGDGTATDVTCRFDPPLQNTRGSEVERFFEVPKTLQPRSRVAHSFDTWPGYFQKKLPLKYQVTISYRDQDTNESYSSDQVLDASAIEHLTQWSPRGLPELIDVVEGMRGELRSELRSMKELAYLRHSIEEVQQSDRVVDAEMTAAGSVSELLGLWGAHTYVLSDPNAIPNWEAWLFVLRRASVTAAARVMSEGLSNEESAAILDVFVSLHHYHASTPVGPEADRIAKAFSRLELAVGRQATPARKSPIDG